MAESPRKKSAKKSPAGAQAAPAMAERPVRPVHDRLPRMSAVQAAALRGLFGAPQTWTLPDNGLLQFIPGKPAPAAQTFELDAEGTRLGLSLRTAPAATGDLHWSDYLGRARVLAWSLAHETPLMRLSTAFGVVLTPIPEPPGPAPDDDVLWLDFIVDEDHGDGGVSRLPALQGALRVPAGWTERLLERADPPYEDATLPAVWSGLGVPVSLQWRIPPLPLTDFQGLRPGDVLVAGRRSQAPQAEACIRGLAWPLAPASGGWRISGAPRHRSPVHQESPMNDNSNGAGGADDAEGAATLARQLPVEVAFELGRSELRVGELSSLQPGYVFALAAPAEGANVTIRANGQAVGQGEIVAVGDTLGVRLLWWH